MCAFTHKGALGIWERMRGGASSAGLEAAATFSWVFDVEAALAESG